MNVMVQVSSYKLQVSKFGAKLDIFAHAIIKSILIFGIWAVIFDVWSFLEVWSLVFDVWPPAREAA